MSLPEKAYRELFGNEPKYAMGLRYSAKFKGYNANIKQQGRKIILSLSRNWESVDEDIQLGILQSLLCKLFKCKKNTVNIDMYTRFLQNVHVAIPQSESEPELRESFHRVNEEYFNGLMDIASLQWSNNSVRCFGSYDYGIDTIKINPALKNRPYLLDYVMYHEMLHKRFKFKARNNKSYHHTKEFREAENKYPRKKELERELGLLAKKLQYKNKFINLLDWF